MELFQPRSFLKSYLSDQFDENLNFSRKYCQLQSFLSVNYLETSPELKIFSDLTGKTFWNKICLCLSLKIPMVFLTYCIYFWHCIPWTPLANKKLLRLKPNFAAWKLILLKHSNNLSNLECIIDVKRLRLLRSLSDHEWLVRAEWRELPTEKIGF